MIQFKEVSKTYKDLEILKSVNLHIKTGEFMVLVGPSGSGKTTMLKMVNRLIEPSSGEIYVDNRPVHELNLRDLRLEIGYVLQQIALFPNQSG